MCEMYIFRPLEEVVAKKIKQQWDPDHQIIISPLSTPASGLMSKRKRCIVDDPMDFVDVNRLSSWNLHDLTAAAKLLRRPPLPCQFDDEHEMRRVYSMIYDVYRCKWCRCIRKGEVINWFATCATSNISQYSLDFVHLCRFGFSTPINFIIKGLLWHSDLRLDFNVWFPNRYAIWFDCQFQKRSWQLICHWFYCEATRNQMKR